MRRKGADRAGLGWAMMISRDVLKALTVRGPARLFLWDGLLLLVALPIHYSAEPDGNSLVIHQAGELALRKLGWVERAEPAYTDVIELTN
jgi:hypothetical protein